MIFYSLFMLPVNSIDRNKIYKTFLDNKKELHFALEEMTIKTSDDVNAIEEIFLIKKKLKDTKKKIL
jgi:sporadic carbohydrate cluster protein (TIGR04323 family)